MTTKVEKSILVNVPVGTAYNQWTQFEDFPQFMGGVKSVTHSSDDTLQWVAEIAGVRRQWTAKILEQVPDRKVAWAATEGATNAGEVTFEDVGGGQTSVRLSLEYEPEGLLEKVGDKLNIVEKQAEGDLDRFKAFIEAEGYATGAWRGTVNEGASAGTPGVEHADASRGDSGKAGVSGKAVAAGVGLATAAAVGAVAAGAAKKREEADETVVERDTAEDTGLDVGTPLAAMPDTGGATTGVGTLKGDLAAGTAGGAGYGTGTLDDDLAAGTAGDPGYGTGTGDDDIPPDNTLGQPIRPDRV